MAISQMFPGHNVGKIRHDDDTYLFDGPFHMATRVISDKIEEALSCRERIDGNLVILLTHHVEQAQAGEYIGRRNAQNPPDGFIRKKLTHVGCRVYMTQQTMAGRIGRGRDHVNKQIKLLKKYQIITNSGRGWYEFDPVYIWRGDFELRTAYVNALNDEAFG